MFKWKQFKCWYRCLIAEFYLTNAIIFHYFRLQSNNLLWITLLTVPPKHVYNESYMDKWRFSMMTSSNGNIFRVTGHLCWEFTARSPVTRSSDVFFDVHPSKRLSKQWWGWWFQTPSGLLWGHRNGKWYFKVNWFTIWRIHYYIPNPLAISLTCFLYDFSGAISHLS